MYKAIKEIGGYQIGDEVPTEKALVWLEMYSVPHVEKIDGDEKNEKPKVEITEKPKVETTSADAMLDDYLGRNEGVVKNNIKKDNLSKKQLDGLLELEKSNKKRNAVINALENKLKILEN